MTLCNKSYGAGFPMLSFLYCYGSCVTESPGSSGRAPSARAGGFPPVVSHFNQIQMVGGFPHNTGSTLTCRKIREEKSAQSQFSGDLRSHCPCEGMSVQLEWVSAV